MKGGRTVKWFGLVKQDEPERVLLMCTNEYRLLLSSLQRERVKATDI